MIGYLEGTIIESLPGKVLLSVGGVGYLVNCRDEIALPLTSGDPCSLYTHLVVRETVLDLYGFVEKQELEFFQLLITISGIGPKVALSILNVAHPETLFTAISNNDTSVLTKVSGIGKKNADKIVLELKNKMDQFSDSFNETTGSADEVEVFEVLEALGFDARSIQTILKDDQLSGLSGSARIKAAIKLLGK